MTHQPPCRLLTRRNTLGVAGAGLAAPLLAACGGSSPAETGETSSAPAASSAAPSEPAGSGPAGSAPAGGGTPLASTSEIEVGGGTIFADQKVVVTQPEEGVFKAFETTCTHAGCAVTDVENGQIVCPCHFSQFSVADGEVTEGPADAPLPEVEIAVEGDQIMLL